MDCVADLDAEFVMVGVCELHNLAEGGG